VPINWGNEIYSFNFRILNDRLFPKNLGKIAIEIEIEIAIDKALPSSLSMATPIAIVPHCHA
jgi:hypothetical protein